MLYVFHQLGHIFRFMYKTNINPVIYFLNFFNNLPFILFRLIFRILALFTAFIRLRIAWPSIGNVAEIWGHKIGTTSEWIRETWKHAIRLWWHIAWPTRIIRLAVTLAIIAFHARTRIESCTFFGRHTGCWHGAPSICSLTQITLIR